MAPCTRRVGVRDRNGETRNIRGAGDWREIADIHGAVECTDGSHRGASGREAVGPGENVVGLRTGAGNRGARLEIDVDDIDFERYTGAGEPVTLRARSGGSGGEEEKVD